jgi:hypothetical protein
MSAQNFEIYLSFNASSGGFLQAFFERSRDKIMAIFEKNDAGEGADAGLAQSAAAVHPEPASTDDYIARQPYTNPGFVTHGIQEAEERGWITLEDGGFKATDKALALTGELIQLLHEDLDPLEEKVSVDVPALVKQLGMLVDSAAKVDLPYKPTFTFSRNFEYEDKTPNLTWVRRHLISLGAFRDDCHLSSWKHHDLPGHVWETLTFIWQGEINTAEKLAETLSGYRGYQAEDYASAIEQLAALGWVEPADDHYQATAEGRKVREASEELTNQYYARALKGLPETELTALTSQLETLAAEIAPEPVEAE